MSLGEFIKAVRNRLNLSQDELAEKIGCSRISLSKWERDIVKPTDLSKISALEDALNFKRGTIFNFIADGYRGNPSQPSAAMAEKSRA